MGLCFTTRYIVYPDRVAQALSTPGNTVTFPCCRGTSTLIVPVAQGNAPSPAPPCVRAVALTSPLACAAGRWPLGSSCVCLFHVG